MRQLILLGLFGLWTPLTGHSQIGHDTIYYSKKIKKVEGKILSSTTIGIADTTIALIKGQVFDNESRGVQSEITIKSLQSKLNYCKEAVSNIEAVSFY